jgi:hypothetical protein
LDTTDFYVGLKMRFVSCTWAKIARCPLKTGRESPAPAMGRIFKETVL